MGADISVKHERAGYIEQKAREIAESGEYKDSKQIEIQLQKLGFHEAAQELESPIRRDYLDRLCKFAHMRRLGA